MNPEVPVIVHERPDGQWSPDARDRDPADYTKPPMAEFPILPSPGAVLNERAERVRISDELALLSGKRMSFGELESIVAGILLASKFEHFRKMAPRPVAERICEVAYPAGIPRRG